MLRTKKVFWVLNKETPQNTHKTAVLLFFVVENQKQFRKQKQQFHEICQVVCENMCFFCFFMCFYTFYCFLFLESVLKFLLEKRFLFFGIFFLLFFNMFLLFGICSFYLEYFLLIWNILGLQPARPIFH